MGRRGPAAKPSVLKKREGTYRADRAPKREPEPEAGVGPMPAGIKRDKVAKACWENLAPLLLKLRLMAVGDWLDFAGLCRAWADAQALDDDVHTRGRMMDTPWGPKLNPAVTASRLAWDQVRKFAAEFGLSPASRSRVSAGAPEPDAKDQAEDFLFGNGGKVVGSIGA